MRRRAMRRRAMRRRAMLRRRRRQLLRLWRRASPLLLLLLKWRRLLQWRRLLLRRRVPLLLQHGLEQIAQFALLDQIDAQVERVQRRILRQRRGQCGGSAPADGIVKEGEVAQSGRARDGTREDGGAGVADDVVAQLEMLQAWRRRRCGQVRRDRRGATVSDAISRQPEVAKLGSSRRALQQLQHSGQTVVTQVILRELMEHVRGTRQRNGRVSRRQDLLRREGSGGAEGAGAGHGLRALADHLK